MMCMPDESGCRDKSVPVTTFLVTAGLASLYLSVVRTWASARILSRTARQVIAS